MVGSTAQIGAYDFYPAGGNGPSQLHFVDDMVLQPGSLQPIAPATDYSFEAWGAGDFIAVVDASWDTWSSAPGGSEDAQVSTDQAQSGSNSLKLENTSTDAIFLMGNQTTGTWEAGFSVYVPTGNSAYYNIQEDETPAVNWMIEVNFDDGGTGTIVVDQSQVGTFTYPMDTWVDVRHYIDLDNDSIQLFIDGTFYYGGKYTAVVGSTAQIGAFNFYPDGGNGPGIIHYLDDMVYQAGSLQPTALRDNIAIDFNMYPNPAEDRVTIVNSISGESVIAIKDAVGRVQKEVRTFNNSVTIDVAELEPGIYFVEMRNGNQRGVSKLIVR